MIDIQSTIRGLMKCRVVDNAFGQCILARRIIIKAHPVQSFVKCKLILTLYRVWDVNGQGRKTMFVHWIRVQLLPGELRYIGHFDPVDSIPALKIEFRAFF